MENTVDRPKGMRKSEIEVLCELITSASPKRVLEIGMAYGSSTIAILEILKDIEDASLVSIDPYQNAPIESVKNDNIDGYGGLGVKNVEEAGFSDLHTLQEAPSYLALPDLVSRSEHFDFIFIDGYHSFDFTLVDFFYSDLLLRDGGILAIHDTAAHAVHAVCRFIEHNKPYEVLGPPIEQHYKSPAKKIARRIRYLCNGKNDVFTERRERWCSLGAFRKKASIQCPQYTLFGM